MIGRMARAFTFITNEALVHLQSDSQRRARLNRTANSNGMDLLAGYGSGSESDSDGDVRAGPSSPGAHHKPPPHSGRSTAAVAQPARAGGLFNSLPKPKNNPIAGNKADASASGLPAGFFDSVPAEALDSAQEAAPSGLPVGFFDAAPPAVPPQGLSTNGVTQQQASEDVAAPLFSKLPAASKRKVLLRPQIDLQLLAQQSDSDEDEPVAKKIKAAAPAAGKASVLSFLPAPKHTAGKRVDSSGFAEAAKQRQQQQQQQREAATAAAAAAAASVGPQAPAGNEVYRLRPAAPAAAADTYYHDHQQQHYGQHEQQYDQHASHGYAAAVGSSTMQQPQQQPQRYQQLPPEEAFLQEALQAEASKAARRTAGAGSSQLQMPDIQFKEVRADEVKYVDPAQREAAQGMRSALGTDYAQQLRSQAAPHMGSKLARSKHQIGTLFANAKLRELEVMENRASGMKSKAETAGKYGW